MGHIRQKAVEGLQAGDNFTVSRSFSQEDVLRFAEISRDYNPVHLDERFSGVKRFEGPICHGLLVGSLVTEVGGQIGWLASGMRFRFMRPVYVGDTIQCDFTITDIDEGGRARAEAVFTNASTGLTVMECVLTGIVPGAQEKQVMQAMLDEGDPTNGVRGP